jgi:cytidyltransferase-like protein
VLKDADTPYYHVKDGERLTVGQPYEYDKSIWFFGPCMIRGRLAEDSHTIESYLQGLINEDGYKVRVVNCGVLQDELALWRRICATEFKKGDMVVVYCENKTFDGIPNLNLADCVERENVPAKWMVDDIRHCNHKLYRLYAEEIYKFIKGQLDEKSADEKADQVTLPIDIQADDYMARYFSGFKPTGTVGSIVMNCNPFTYGNRYLIEQALEQVDNLIIFVVQEDKSLFTFRERIAMVREGTKDLEHVTVVPSGDFILSQLTFPEYFMKVEDEDLEYNTEYDITLFAEEIAPRLNITVRFVGEEKADEVTNRYNLAMKKILPKHGIRIVEIPRKVISDGKQPISATKVREILEKNGELAHTWLAANADGGCILAEDELTGLIPEGTRKLLLQTWE